MAIKNLSAYFVNVFGQSFIVIFVVFTFAMAAGATTTTFVVFAFHVSIQFCSFFLLISISISFDFPCLPLRIFLYTVCSLCSVISSEHSTAQRIVIQRNVHNLRYTVSTNVHLSVIMMESNCVELPS